jgi:hypothetical protein
LFVLEGADGSKDPDFVSATLRAADGSTFGVSVRRQWSRSEQVSWVADRAHDGTVEELSRRGRSTSWPLCPEHPETHPMSPRVVDQVAVWVCPRSNTAVTPIGSLTP